MAIQHARSVLLGILAFAGASSAQLGSREDWSCGNVSYDKNGNIINDADSWITDHIVNDRFPPNEYITGFVVPTIASPDKVWAQRNCTPIGVAEWSPACLEHDRCMDAEGSYGLSSQQCNQNILDGWISSCGKAYKLTWEEADLVYGRTKASWATVASWDKIGTKVACFEICKNMAELSQKAMLLGMSRTFSAQKPPTGTTSPAGAAVPLTDFTFVGRTMGMGAHAQDRLKQVWNATTKQYELVLEEVNASFPRGFNQDEDMVFGNQPAKGNFQMEATVNKIGRVSYHKKVGVGGLMIRNGFETGSRFFKVFANFTGSEITVRYRATDNGPVSETKTTVPSGHKRYRIIKYGNRVVPFYLDGNSKWVQLASANIGWSETVYTGVFTDYDDDGYWVSKLWAGGYFSDLSLKKHSGPGSAILSLLAE